MKRKISILGILLLALTFVVPAQEKRVEFGLSAGYGFAFPRSKTGNKHANIPTGIDQTNMNGFHAGPTLKVNINEEMGIHTGVLFNYLSGVSLDASQAFLKEKGTWFQMRAKVMDIDVPLRYSYSAPLTEELKISLFAGPNFNYAIQKTVSKEYFVDNVLKNTNTTKNIYDSTDYKAFDLQLGAGLIVTYEHVSLQGGYDWGILNRTTINDRTFRSNSLKFTLSYIF